MWFAIAFVFGISPRFIMFLIWLLSDYFERAFEGVLLPLLGFIFLPWTTLWCAYAFNNGGFDLFRYIVLIVCVLIDFFGDKSIFSSKKD